MSALFPVLADAGAFHDAEDGGGAAALGPVNKDIEPSKMTVSKPWGLSQGICTRTG